MYYQIILANMVGHYFLMYINLYLGKIAECDLLLPVISPGPMTLCPMSAVLRTTSTDFHPYVTGRIVYF